ncbi:grasp-with-spasm system SPASM domain peptide maturase [Elizabethkingia meningoseptica]|nr:grasp-with-spasm system SPASM domain peptide maturase [Elizabethkingia meningoseptica]
MLDPFYKDDTDLHELIVFLFENKFIYYSNIEIKSKENLEFITPFKIEDIIIDAKTGTDLLEKIKSVDLIIENIQIRIFGDYNLSDLQKSIAHLSIIGINNIEIVLNYIESILINDLVEFYNSNNCISRIVIAGFHKFKKIKDYSIFCIPTKILSCNQCGIINEQLFLPNQRTYLSSLGSNSCLSKKIAIDINNNIKNCPSMPQSFGTIKENTLSEILNHNELKKYWNLTKDSINVCKDCEFRYICTDCRAYTERSHFDKSGLDISKPLKCGYNPYTGEWQNWSSSPLKQRAIEFYNL